MIKDSMDIQDLTVILVEPSSTQQRIIDGYLRSPGIGTIDSFDNGRQALDEIRRPPPDLVIADYNMPEMDGEERVDYIRRNSVQPGIPILMVTSESNQRRLAAVHGAGVSAICDKPFEPITLKRFLERILVET